MAKVLLAKLRMKKALFSGGQSIYAIGGIAECHRIYYNGSQQHILDNFLRIIAMRLNKREVIYDQSQCYQSKQFIAVRLVDP